MKKAPASLNSFVSTLPCGPDLAVGTTATQLEKLKAMGVIRSRNERGQVAALHHPRQSRCGYRNGRQSQSSSQNCLTHAEL